MQQLLCRHAAIALSRRSNQLNSNFRAKCLVKWSIFTNFAE